VVVAVVAQVVAVAVVAQVVAVAAQVVVAGELYFFFGDLLPLEIDLFPHYQSYDRILE
jgi:hypothetical protein